MAIKQNRLLRYFDARVKVIGLLDNNYPGRFTEADYRDGAYDPYWNSKIKERRNATTPLYAYRLRADITSGMCRYKFSTTYRAEDSDQGLNALIPSSTLGSGAYPQFWTKNNALVSEATAKARTQAFSKINSIQGKVGGQVFLGELRQTVDLLRDPLHEARKLFLTLSKNHSYLRNIPTKDFAKASADLWLQFRFAILPLISDVQEIIALINDQNTLEKLSYRFYARAESAVARNPIVTGADVYYNSFGRDLDKAECIIHMGLVSERIHRADEASERLLQAVTQFSELPSTAWELFPWSFLVDYFVNVGDIIEASTTAQSELSYSSESNIYTQERDIRILSVNRGAAAYVTDIQLTAPRRMLCTSRVVNRTGGSLAIPPLTVSLPGSSIRYANIAALLTKFL